MSTSITDLDRLVSAAAEAAQRHVTEHERGRRHLAGLAAHHAVVHQHATVGQDGSQVVGADAADRIDTQAHLGTTGGRTHALGQVRSVHQHQIGAFGLHAGDRRLAAHHVDGLEAAQLGQLDQVAANAGVGGVLDDPVTRLEVDELAEQ